MFANSLEELDVWKMARQLTKQVYLITSEGAFARDFGLKDQIQRASVSVMSNIAEGFERNSKRQFRHFLSIAKGSAGEVKSQLYIAYDLNYINEERFKELIHHLENLGRMLGSLMKSLSVPQK